LSFDLAQDGELTEPFGICYLKFDIYTYVSSCSSLLKVIQLSASIRNYSDVSWESF